MRNALVLTPLFVTSLVFGASAQQAPDGWSVGAVGVISNTPYVGEDTQFLGLPNITYRNGPFSIGAQGLSYTVLDQGDAALDLIVTPRFSALDDPDSAALVGIDRDLTIDAGLRYTLSFTSGASVRATFLQEVTGEHDGQELDLRGTQTVGPFGFPIGVYAGATWRSDDLSNYLYGVFASEARVGRPAYSTAGTITPYIGVSGFVPLSQNWGLIGSMRADFLGDDITDSPIVEDETVISATLGVSFRF